MGTPTCIISIKIVTHTFTAETFNCINATETLNCIIATEIVFCIIATKSSTNITSRKYNLIAIEPQNLHDCNGRCNTCIITTESVICIVPTETAAYRIDYRNFHLQKWCQSKILLVTIKKLSKWVNTKFLR